MPQDQWPDPVLRAFAKINKKIYIPMQGPSEMGASGKLENWDRTADLPKITVPTLAIGARYDTMEPAQMERIAKDVKKGRYLYCPKGSHLALYDDQQVYMDGPDEIHSGRGRGPLLGPQDSPPDGASAAVAAQACARYFASGSQ